LRFPFGNTLKKPFQLLFVLLGCLHMAGGPYSIMQGYAWIGMLVSYSQQDGIIQATKDTFSGEKPCKLCCKIVEEKKQDRNPKDPVAPASTLSAKLVQEMLPARITFLSPPASIDLPPVVFPGVQTPIDILRASPPVPPPCRAA
jgi:hypothetical protein